MANFVLTLDCNKGCKYCFAAESRQLETENRVMTLEYFSELLDKLPMNQPVKILGGEPTSHPQFDKIIEMVQNKNRFVTLISNFLFDKDKLEIVKNIFTQDNRNSALINSTDLDVGNRIEIFSRNYKEIYNILYPKGLEENLSCGLTLDPKKSIEYYIKYIDFLVKNLVKIERLRISISFPGSAEEKDNFFFINNKEIGKMILILTKKAIDIGAVPTLDCILFPCVFSNKEEFKFVKKFMQKFKTSCGEAVPTDLFPDGTASYCYPLKNISVETKHFKNTNDVSKALMMKYQIQQSVIEIPEECKKCNFHNSKMCSGPCLGFYKIKNLI